MTRKLKNVIVGQNTKIWEFTNLYDCKIGSDCMIGAFVEIQKGVVIGNDCRIQSHTFICEGVKIDDNVFVGHGVMFINDKYPPSDKTKWKSTLIEEDVVIGSNATILPVKIGKGVVVGAGAVVTKDLPAHSVVVGNPAKVIKWKYSHAHTNRHKE